MPLRKKLIRTILEKKAQFFSAWFLIVMSSIVFYSFTAAGANLVDNLNEFNEKKRVEDAQFSTAEPLKEIGKLEKQHNVVMEHRYTADVAYSDDAVLRLLDAAEKVNLHSVVEGEDLDSDQDILIDQGFAKANGIAVGDEIEWKGTSFTVAGFMAIPDYIYPLKDVSGFLKNPEAFGTALVQQSVLEEWEGSSQYYSVRFSNGNKEEFKKQLNEDHSVLSWVDQKENNRISFIKGDITGIKKMGEFLPVGILLISLTIILILLWRLMKKEYVQIGTMYALGYKRSEIIRHYLSYAGILAISGSVAGTLIGWFVLEPLLSMFAAFYNLPVLVIRPHMLYVAISLLLPSVLFLPMTYWLISRVLKIPPVSLMKGGERKLKVSRVERAIKLKKLPFKRKFVIREMMRNVPRVIFLTIGVMFATLLLLFGFITKNSMEYLVKDHFNDVYHYEYHYVLNAWQTEKPAEGEIGSAAPFTFHHENDKQTVTINGLEPENDAIRLKDSHGEKLSFDSVIITKSLADKTGLEEGNTILVTNELSDTTFDLTVDRVAHSYLGDVIYMPLEEFNQLNGYPSGSYTQIFSQEELDIGDEMVLSVSQSSDTVAGFEQMIEPLNYGIAFIALVAAVIAIIIIYILISLLIEGNSFTISLMKVLGYEESNIRKMMVSYNVWFIIIGFLIGIPVTQLAISSFLDSITAEMNVSFPVIIDWVSILISFVVIVVSYYISLLLNSKKLKRISLTEAINRSTE
ncbi:ABC transporter permease [Bacillus sp. RO3]|nr:ABC transporter permease [Bacillus sp. RO3]